MKARGGAGTCWAEERAQGEGRSGPRGGWYRERERGEGAGPDWAAGKERRPVREKRVGLE